MASSGVGFDRSTFEWFTGLEDHNSKEWFDAHREEFRAHVDEPFARLLDAVSNTLRDAPLPLSGGPGTTFRMNRDVRFSADKSPYNTSRSGLLTPTGTKSESGGVIFLRVGASGGLLAGGLYKPNPAQLEDARQSILSKPERFAAVVARLAEAGHVLDRSDAVKTSPRGYSHLADTPHFDAIRLKQYAVMQTLSPEEWLDPNLPERVAEFAVALTPYWNGSPRRRRRRCGPPDLASRGRRRGGHPPSESAMPAPIIALRQGRPLRTRRQHVAGR